MTKQSVEKLTKAISRLEVYQLIGCPIVICYNLILNAKSDEAKSRLVHTAMLMAQEELRRELDP